MLIFLPLLYHQAATYEPHEDLPQIKREGVPSYVLVLVQVLVVVLLLVVEADLVDELAREVEHRLGHEELLEEVAHLEVGLVQLLVLLVHLLVVVERRVLGRARVVALLEERGRRDRLVRGPDAVRRGRLEEVEERVLFRRWRGREKNTRLD